MKLTEKDKEFLEKLQGLMQLKDLQVELKHAEPSYMVLRGTYGEKIHQTFRITRQGIRWRFWHIFNRTYVEAFETILTIEKDFGTQLRDYAIRISKQRHALRQTALRQGFCSADTLVVKTDGRPR